MDGNKKSRGSLEQGFPQAMLNHDYSNPKQGV